MSRPNKVAILRHSRYHAYCMVSSRVLSSARPVFPYKSNGYRILCYGVFRKGNFKTSEIKSCLSGSFPRTNNRDFLVPANCLLKAGFLVRINRDTWRVTRSGELAMSVAAAYHREFRVRILGPRYMEEATERIRRVNASMMPLEEKLDAEDKILDEIEDRIAARQSKTPYLK